MKGYWARIKGKDYAIAYGWVLNEEFSETLDSATIRLPHVFDILDIKPYDDVIIHDFDPNSDDRLPSRPLGQVFDAKKYLHADGSKHFYRHMLVSNFNREQVNLVDVAERYDDEGNKVESHIFNYSIDLVSETKGLETVQLPNRTISQPMGTNEKGWQPEQTMANVSTRFVVQVGETITSKNISLPISVANNFKQGISFSQGFKFEKHYNFYMYVNDNDSSTSDYSSFTACKKTMALNKPFAFPDWSISGVSVAVYEMPKDQTIGKVKTIDTFHPIKHYIIRKNGINNNHWKTRQNILATIKDYLGITYNEDGEVEYDDSPNHDAYPEIVNNKIINWNTESTFDYDIKTNDPNANIVGAFAEEGSYTVYIYVERKAYKSEYLPVSNAHYNFNVFGMTDNEKGTQFPTVDSEFLCHWLNIEVTDEVGINKSVRTVYEAVRQAVELYSPYIKVTTDGESWSYVRKYSISQRFRDKFFNVIAPENQWNFPNLRDYITRLCYVSDCIPVVHDGVIDYIDISQRDPNPFEVPKSISSFENLSMDGGSYCDRLLRVYNDGLSKDSITTCVERVGFKNRSSDTLTLENLQIELSHPIYKINKVYMCYYNRYSNLDDSSKPLMRLVKQDITSLVLLNSQRNLLTESWQTLQNANTVPKSIEELSKFKFATVGYDIGSKTIGGWGEKYNFPTFLFFKATRCVIENILNFAISRNASGLADNDVWPDYIGDSTVFESGANEERQVFKIENDTVVLEDEPLLFNVINSWGDYFGNYTLKIKSLCFIVEYQGYVSASVLASKDFHDGAVVSRDNASSSLSFVESDGVNQKEKVNRLGNANASTTARYTDFYKIQRLSQVRNDEVPEGYAKLHDDEVLFKRSITFNPDHFSVGYYLCRNYVLRNYFTSVFSRHRPFPLASYEESVERLENRTMEVLMSPRKAFWQDESKYVGFSKSQEDISTLFSFFQPSSYSATGVIINTSLDTAYYVVWPSKENKYQGQCGIFATDMQKFTSGNSLCFTIPMHDNVSAGVYTSDYNAPLSDYIYELISHAGSLLTSTNYWEMSFNDVVGTNVVTGSKQDWFMFPIDKNTGSMYSMSFGIGKTKGDVYGIDDFTDYSMYDIASCAMLPLLDMQLERAEEQGKKYYFGKKIEGGDGVIGNGYPRIQFQKEYTRFFLFSSKNPYYANLSNTGIYFKWDDFVVENPTKFVTAPTYDDDGNLLCASEEIKERNTIDEFLSAKFVGSEEEDGEESDVCVFKDGKERITATIQVEPISEDESIKFSQEMMRLSNALGTVEKNYKDYVTTSDIVIRQNICTIKAVKLIMDAPTMYTSYLDVFSLPCLAISIPATSDEEIYNKLPITINKTFYFHSETQDFEYKKKYRIKVYTIDELFYEDSGRSCIACTCDIQAEFAEHEDKNETLTGVRVVFYDSVFSDVTKGRLGMSDFKTDTICPFSSLGYRTFVFAEDGFFGLDKAGWFKYSVYKTQSSYSFSNVSDAGLFASSSRQGIYGYVVAESYYNNYRQLPYESFRGYYFDINNRNYVDSQFECKWDLAKVGYSYQFVQKGFRNNIRDEFVDIGYIAYAKVRNMYWCLSQNLMSVNTPYEHYDSLGNMTDLEDFTPNINIKIGKHNNKDALVITMPFAVEGFCSLRLYYKEDEIYKFVFGINIDAKANDGQRSDCIYPLDDGVTYIVYLSFLDDRSKSVYNNIEGDPNQGDITYKVVNFAENGEVPSNKVMAK